MNESFDSDEGLSPISVHSPPVRSPDSSSGLGAPETEADLNASRDLFSDEENSNLNDQDQVEGKVCLKIILANSSAKRQA